MQELTYEIDICAPGFERWRREDEHVLPVGFSQMSSQSEMIAALHAAGENLVAAHPEAFTRFVEEAGGRIWSIVAEEKAADPFTYPDDDDEFEDPRHLFVYLWRH